MSITYKKVIFQLYVDDLFNIVRNRTAYISNHAQSQEGSAEKILALTEADRLWFDMNLRYAADSAYERLNAGGYVQPTDYTYTAKDTQGKDYIEYILYLNENWDVNLVPVMNNAIERYITQRVINDWFKECMYVNYLQIGVGELADAEGNLKSILNRRKWPVSRPHTML